MDDGIEKIKKKIRDVFGEDDIDEDSDIPVHEKRVKDRKVRDILKEP